MKENVLDVLMYLFESYMDEEADINPDQASLKLEYVERGFPHAGSDSHSTPGSRLCAQLGATRAAAGSGWNPGCATPGSTGRCRTAG